MTIRQIRLISGFLLLLAALPGRSEQMAQGAVSLAKDYRLDVEIADTAPLREYGLMHREHLQENQGMLFVYPDQALRGVWMKNTLLALDILFLSADGTILSMLRNLLPCRQDPCPIYTSGVPAQYMLEVNSGFIDKHGLAIGQTLMLDYRRNAPADTGTLF